MRNKKKLIKIAIDSPAAAGAGTLAKKISNHYNLYYIYIILLILPYILCIISNDDNYVNYRIILIFVYIMFLYNTSIFENNNYINNLIKYKINKNKNFIDIILTILIIITTITLLNKMIFKL